MSTEIVRTQTKRYQVTSVALDFLTYNDTFRRARKGAKYKGSACFHCRAPFEDGEKMSLLIFSNYANRLVCRACAFIFHVAIYHIALAEGKGERG